MTTTPTFDLLDTLSREIGTYLQHQMDYISLAPEPVTQIELHAVAWRMASAITSAIIAPNYLLVPRPLIDLAVISRIEGGINTIDNEVALLQRDLDILKGYIPTEQEG